eukprot:tig00000198_g16067.t1
MADEEIDLEGDAGLFEEPEGFRPPTPPPSETTFERRSDLDRPGPRTLQLRLPSKHSLWAHMLWNAALCMANAIEEMDLKGQRVLELGCGAGVPSLVAALNGAEQVVMTDYPEEKLLENLRTNARRNLPAELLDSGRVRVMGHLWGKNTEELMDALREGGAPAGSKFDLIILSDLIFNHNQHRQLIHTVTDCLSATGIALVTFSHHRPSLAAKDLAFFQMAEEAGLMAERTGEKKMTPMFEQDEGDPEVRAVVHYWRISRPRAHPLA